MNEQAYSPYASPEPARKPVRFTAREWLALAACLVLALLYWRVYGLKSLFRGIPGLGTTVFVFGLFAVVLAYLGKRARYTLPNGLLLAAVLLLALSCSLFGDQILGILNCFVILGLGAMTIFQLSGQAQKLWSRPSVLAETFVLSFTALFCNLDKPFRALPALRKGKGKGQEVLLGVLVALPVLAVVMALLISADAVFAGVFAAFRSWMIGLRLGVTLWNVVKTLAVMLLLFSAVYGLRHPRARLQPKAKEPGAAEASAEKGGAAAFATVLVLLDVVYALFVVIQIAFLFGGAETAAMKGGYAQYARSGFFQLVLVAAVNLAAVLVTAVWGLDPSKQGRKLLRLLACLLLAETGVILASALWRMCLYISVYGLSLLRAMTLWAMLVIAVGLVVSGIKLFRRQFRFFPVFFAVLVSTWLLFNYSNVDARIANYNVDAYLGGQLQQMDGAYLAGLGPDAIPALERLCEATGEDWVSCIYKPDNGWVSWNLSQVRYK